MLEYKYEVERKDILKYLKTVLRYNTWVNVLFIFHHGASDAYKKPSEIYLKKKQQKKTFTSKCTLRIELSYPCWALAWL